MSNVVHLTERIHARISSAATTAGRATSEGHGVSSGQRSENQRITSSYLRAVKVLPSSSSRSKKRQSPAASRPSVARLTDLAAAYADAHAMRFDRSSVSMASEDSRKIPTSQARNVGNILLAQISATSDKSAMAKADEIRRKLLALFEANGTGPVAIANELGLPRGQISDFMRGKTKKLSAQAVTFLSERFDIPPRDLQPKPDAVVIHKGARPHLYVAEHMEARGLDDRAMASRMDGVSTEAVEKWRSDPGKLADWQVQAILHALGMEDAAQLARYPAKQKAAPRPVAKGRKIA